MYSKGISWIDDCRIPFVDEKENTKRSISGHQKTYGSGEEIYYKLDIQNQEDRNKGRFPANILVSDDMLNDGVISKSTIFDGKQPNIKGGRLCATDIELTDKRAFGGYNDKGTNSRYYDIDKWFEKLLND